LRAAHTVEARIAASTGLTALAWRACRPCRSRLTLLAILPSLTLRAWRAGWPLLPLHAALAVTHHRQALGRHALDARQCLDLGQAQVGERLPHLRLAGNHLRLEQLADALVIRALARHHLAEDFRERIRR